MVRKGRPPTPLNPDASAAAKLGYVLREWRLKRELTQEALAVKVGCAPQHVSEVERAKARPSALTVQAWDNAPATGGELAKLQEAAVRERNQQREQRADARRDQRAAERVCPRCSSLPCVEPGSDTGADREDVDPTNRRGLIGAGAATALSVPVLGTVPSRASEVDPGLVDHWTNLLNLLGRLDAAYGPHEVLPVVERELRLIAAHREIARGDLSIALMRVEARWAQFAAWLSNDAGHAEARRTWADRARRLAAQVDYCDMLAFVYVRHSQWAAQRADARDAIAFAQAALRVPGIAEQTRARSALRAAYGYALANDAEACERSLADGELMMERAGDLPVPPWVGRATIRSHVRPDEARCWLVLRPSKAIGLYEHVLRNWPRHRVRDRGLHQARLAVACATTGELDRAQDERDKALAITRTTKSSGATRELRRLGAILNAA